MDEDPYRLLDEVRGLVSARSLLDDALDDRIQQWLDAGHERSLLADILGVDRSTLYRRHLWRDRGTTRGGQGRTKDGEANP